VLHLKRRYGLFLTMNLVAPPLGIWTFLNE
jgi:hypothetical protein